MPENAFGGAFYLWIFHNAGELLSFLVLYIYSCGMIIFCLVSHWVLSELVGVVIVSYCLYFLPLSPMLNLFHSISDIAVYYAIHSKAINFRHCEWFLLYIHTHTEHIKHVNVSYSNKKTQSIINPISKEKKKKKGDPPRPKWDCKRETGLQNTGVGKQSKLQ